MMPTVQNRTSQSQFNITGYFLSLFAELIAGRILTVQGHNFQRFPLPLPFIHYLYHSLFIIYTYINPFICIKELKQMVLVTFKNA